MLQVVVKVVISYICYPVWISDLKQMVVFFKSSFHHFSYFPGFNSRMMLVWLQGIFNQIDIFWTKKGSRLHMWPLMISVSFVSSGVMWLNNDRDTGLWPQWCDIIGLRISYFLLSISISVLQSKYLNFENSVTTKWRRRAFSLLKHVMI